MRTPRTHETTTCHSRAPSFGYLHIDSTDVSFHQINIQNCEYEESCRSNTPPRAKLCNVSFSPTLLGVAPRSANASSLEHLCDVKCCTPCYTTQSRYSSCRQHHTTCGFTHERVFFIRLYSASKNWLNYHSEDAGLAPSGRLLPSIHHSYKRTPLRFLSGPNQAPIQGLDLAVD